MLTAAVLDEGRGGADKSWFTMALTTSYLTTTKNLEGILNAIQMAQAPEKFTTRFLESLGFKTATDRLMIGVLKGLRFLDEAAIPTERYYQYLDQTEAGRVLADGIREAYEDLFRVNTKANQLSEADVKNKLKTLTQGQKSEEVVSNMAKTFVALCGLADWSISPPVLANADKPNDQITTGAQLKEERANYQSPSASSKANVSLGQLAYNIQINLPVTRDSAVYDAIFKSLREHLLQ